MEFTTEVCKSSEKSLAKLPDDITVQRITKNGNLNRNYFTFISDQLRVPCIARFNLEAIQIFSK